MGGGLWCEMGGKAEVRRCLFEGNRAQAGGGAGCHLNSEARFYRNTFVHHGTGCLYLRGGYVSVEGNLLVDTEGAAAIYCWPDADLMLWKNDFWGSGAGNLAGSCPEPVFPDAFGNISADPLFCDPDLGDYRLQPGSPAVVGVSDTLGAFGCGCSTR